ncbi:MAG: zf-HC2 domain-containing protein [Anaerolineales bacterium]|nr:zf-HC2 domain-containing protein [Anaerolineales bacterium]
MTKHADCHTMLASLSEFLDGELKDEFYREINRHLAECQDCRVVFNTLKKTIDLYHSASDIQVPSGIRERLFRCLNLEDYLINPNE